MTELPITQHSLLVRLQDGLDQDAWRQFVHRYAPVVYGYARKRGLQDADAEDLTQDVLRDVAAALARCAYDRLRGPFRGWLFTLVHHRWHDLVACQRRHGRGTGDSGVQELLEEQPARPQDVALWDQEYEHQMFTWAVEHVRSHFQESTWQAFWLTAVEGQSGKAAARTLRMKVAAVYLAKSRVMARLKEQIQLLSEDGDCP